MYTRGILERYADSLSDPDRTQVRAAIALIMLTGADAKDICYGEDVNKIFALPALRHLADDFNSRWIGFLQQSDFDALGKAMKLK